jgi:MAF protein
MLLLASQSPRRRKLLSLSGWQFKTSPAEVDESPMPAEEPQAYVLRLAGAKAQAATDQARPGWFVVGADTVVVDDLRILGKPADEAQAQQMLARLRGRTHQVLTALAALRLGDGAMQTDICTTEVAMRRYSDAELQAYVATGDPLDKAGAYAIQHPGFRPVEALRGCYTNVVGLPLCRMTRLLNRLGLPSPAELPAPCRQPAPEHCGYYDLVI